MNKASDFVKISFYDSVAKENVDVVELQDIREELRNLIKEKGLKDKWISEFFEL